MPNHVKNHRKPRLLAVFAHPDDETFCAGGTLAQKVAAGWEVMVVSATRGQAGQIHDPQAATRRTLGLVREREFYAACEQLGIHHARVLDYMDGALADVDPHELTGVIVKIIRAFRPEVVITFGPDGAYGHPDHIAIGAATTLAFEQAGSPQHYPEQLATGRRAHQPTQLYHSHFPQSRLPCVTAWPTGWLPPRHASKAQASLSGPCRCSLLKLPRFAMPAITSMWNGFRPARILSSRTNQVLSYTSSFQGIRM